VEVPGKGARVIWNQQVGPAREARLRPALFVLSVPKGRFSGYHHPVKTHLPLCELKAPALWPSGGQCGCQRAKTENLSRDEWQSGREAAGKGARVIVKTNRWTSPRGSG
jgi:hypothetical protein